MQKRWHSITKAFCNTEWVIRSETKRHSLHQLQKRVITLHRKETGKTSERIIEESIIIFGACCKGMFNVQNNICYCICDCQFCRLKGSLVTDSHCLREINLFILRVSIGFLSMRLLPNKKGQKTTIPASAFTAHTRRFFCRLHYAIVCEIFCVTIIIKRS